MKMIIDAITWQEDAYTLVIVYCVIKFSSELVNNLWEITFATISANAEVFISSKVYNHVLS